MAQTSGSMRRLSLLLLVGAYDALLSFGVIVSTGFRETTEGFMRDMRRISLSLMEAMAEALSLPASYFTEHLGLGDEPHIRFKIVRYPDVSEVIALGGNKDGLVDCII